MDGALNQGTYRERVIQDQRQAVDLGITARHTMMSAARMGRRKRPKSYPAQPYETVKAAIERAKRPR